MERSDRRMQEPFQSDCAQRIFGLWRAPIFPPAASEDGAKVVQGHDKGAHLPKSPKSLVHPLHRALLSAQDMIKKLTCENAALRRENARLTLEELSTSEALEELRGLYAQAKDEKEELEARIEKMEETFQNERTICQDLSGEQLAEISSLKIKASVAQSHSHRMAEEVRESNRELYEVRRQLTSLKESERMWHRRASQLEEEVKEKRSLVSSLIDLLSQNQSEPCQSQKKWGSEYSALEESYRKELAEKEESWRRRVLETERKNELERTWLQKETEWRQKTSTLEEEIKCLTRERTQLQELAGKKKKRKPWWKKRVKFRRRTQRDTGGASEETAVLLGSESKEK